MIYTSGQKPSVIFFALLGINSVTSKLLDHATTFHLQLPIHQYSWSMEVQDLPISGCLNLCQTNPTFEGLLHSTIGMKVKGVICKVTGGIDGVQTEFLSQSDRTSGHGPVKSPTIRGTSEANVEGMVVDGFQVGCESEFLVQTQYSRCKI